MSENNILQQLDSVLKSRRNAAAETSYVASLYQGGAEAVLAKVEEEAQELCEAVRTCERQDGEAQRAQVIHEAADLWFHALVAAHYCGVEAGDILAELQRREGTSGHDEKRSRGEGDQPAGVSTK